MPDTDTCNNHEICLFKEILRGIHIRHKGDLKKKLTVFLRNYFCPPKGGTDSFLRLSEQRRMEVGRSALGRNSIEAGSETRGIIVGRGQTGQNLLGREPRELLRSSFPAASTIGFRRTGAEDSASREYRVRALTEFPLCARHY